MGTVVFENVDEYDLELIYHAVNQRFVKAIENKMHAITNKSLSEEHRNWMIDRADHDQETIERIKNSIKYLKDGESYVPTTSEDAESGS